MNNDVLEILERELSCSDKYSDLTDAIKENKEFTKREILNSFHFHEFFHVLLDLAEKNWVESNANDIVDSVYKKENWISSIELIKKERMILYKRIMTKDVHSRNLLCKLT